MKLKGNLGGQIGGLITGVVMLFIGLFLINAVSSTGTWTTYSYTTATNGTNLTDVNLFGNATHLITTTNLISSAPATLTIAWVNVTTAGDDALIYLNGVLLDTEAIPSAYATYTANTTFNNGVNTLAFNLTDVDANITIDSSTISYANSRVATGTFGTLHASLVTTTGTIFAVLGLVIIVVSLAMAINSLKGSV